jgi:hypothetical protein
MRFNNITKYLFTILILAVIIGATSYQFIQNSSISSPLLLTGMAEASSVTGSVRLTDSNIQSGVSNNDMIVTGLNMKGTPIAKK